MSDIHKPTHRSWGNMKQRCKNPNAPNYFKYGGRGIKICERWELYKNFLADMGERPDGCTLERIDNDGDYKPSNCRWATPLEQTHNRRPHHNAVPERACLVCGVVFKPPTNKRAGKYCSKACDAKGMIGHDRNGVNLEKRRLRELKSIAN